MNPDRTRGPGWSGASAQRLGLLIAWVSAVAGAAEIPADILWARAGGGTESDIGYGVGVDLSGNVFVTGLFSGTSALGGTRMDSAGASDVFVAKYDPDGRPLWIRRGGGPGYDEGRAVAVDQAGNVYVTGLFQVTASFGTASLSSSGESDVFVAKYDPAGTLVWVRRAGGNDFEESRAIALDGAGNLYLTGYFDANATFGASVLRNSTSSSDIFIAKCDGNGNFLWARAAGGDAEDTGLGIASDPSGQVYVTGFFSGLGTFGSTNLSSSGTADLKDVFLAAYDTSGNLRWVRQAGGAGEDAGNGVAIDHEGGVYVTGHFFGAATFGSTTLTGSGQDIFIAKYDAAGSLAWLRKAGGNNAIYGDSGHGVTVDALRNVYVAGYFSGTASFGPTNVATSGFDDAFVAKYDSAGVVQWVRKAGGGNLDLAYSIALDSATNLCVSGLFYGTAIFGGTAFTSSGLEDVFWVKLGQAQRPSITASRTGNQFLLAWPAWASEFVLEAAETPSPALDWILVPTSGNQATVPVSGARRFFRLRKN